MRAVSLPHFPRSLPYLRVGATALLLLIALIVLLVFGATDSGALPLQIADPRPFRWA